MFGLFNGLFGDGPWADAAEMAMEMCLLDEMEREELLNSNLDDLTFDDI